MSGHSPSSTTVSRTPWGPQASRMTRGREKRIQTGGGNGSSGSGTGCPWLCAVWGPPPSGVSGIWSGFSGPEREGEWFPINSGDDMEETQMDASRRARPAELDSFCLPAGERQISKFRRHFLFHVRKHHAFPFHISVCDCESSGCFLWETQTYKKFNNLKHYPATVHHPMNQR